MATKNTPRIMVKKTCIYPISTSIEPDLNFLTIEINFGSCTTSDIYNVLRNYFYTILIKYKLYIRRTIYPSCITKC